MLLRTVYVVTDQMIRLSQLCDEWSHLSYV